MAVQVTTNNHKRDFLYRYEVPAPVLANELDWTDETDCDGYIKYRGYWYHLSQFMWSHATLAGVPRWEGAHGDSFFSGIVIRLCDHGETYQIGTYIQRG